MKIYCTQLVEEELDKGGLGFIYDKYFLSKSPDDTMRSYLSKFYRVRSTEISAGFFKNLSQFIGGIKQTV